MSLAQTPDLDHALALDEESRFDEQLVNFDTSTFYFHWPDQYDEVMTKASELEQQHGRDGGRATAYNYSDANGSSVPPDVTLADLKHLKRRGGRVVAVPQVPYSTTHHPPPPLPEDRQLPYPLPPLNPSA